VFCQKRVGRLAENLAVAGRNAGPDGGPCGGPADNLIGHSCPRSLPANLLETRDCGGYSGLVDFGDDQAVSYDYEPFVQAVETLSGQGQVVLHILPKKFPGERQQADFKSV
jgi:hypothetical protein